MVKTLMMINPTKREIKHKNSMILSNSIQQLHYAWMEVQVHTTNQELETLHALYSFYKVEDGAQLIIFSKATIRLLVFIDHVVILELRQPGPHL